MYRNYLPPPADKQPTLEQTIYNHVAFWNNDPKLLQPVMQV